MEVDDPTDAVGDGGGGGEQDVTEEATVLLSVLHVDFLETLCHGSLEEEGTGIISHWSPSRHQTTGHLGLTC